MYSNICSYRKFIFVTPWFLLFSVSLIVTTWYGLSENLLWYCTHTVASSRKALIGELLDYPLTTQVVLLGLKFEELSWDYAKPSQENNEDCLPCLFIQFCVIENGRRVSKILQVTSWLIVIDYPPGRHCSFPFEVWFLFPNAFSRGKYLFAP